MGEPMFKVGDLVYRQDGGYSSRLTRRTVERVTKTRAVVGKENFNIESGIRIPRSDWGTPKIFHPTPELDRRYVRQEAKGAARTLASVAVDFVNDRVPAGRLKVAYENWLALQTRLDFGEFQSSSDDWAGEADCE